MEIKACPRGFSFMPKSNFETIDLKYVEKNALEQTWRASRRERQKQQEQKIWEEFVQEKDIVSSVCKDDPYQFLHDLPEVCLKELLDVELQRMKKEHIVEELEQQQAIEEVQPTPESDNQHVVTFVEESDKEEMFHIFSDDKEDEVSGPEEEALNDSGSPPCTVRERQYTRDRQSPSKSLSPDKVSSKSSENVTSMIEGSIYCAKVKDLRIKVNQELLDIIETLDRQDLTKIEPEEIPKLLKRSTEFCTRFNRIHMYQLQRQLHDIQRHNAGAPALARHTHCQAQLLRISCFHQNLLQAMQIFHKSIPQTACIKESGDALRNVARTIVESSSICRAAATPSSLTAARDLYNDDVEKNCSNLEGCLNEYNTKLSEYLDQFGHTGKPKKGKYKGKKGSQGTWSKSGTKSGTDTDARLSMYSLETLRLHFNSKSSLSKDRSSGTSKVRGGLSSRRKQADKSEVQKSPRKSPKSRRPLMRDPARGQPRRNLPRELPRELDVPTLVESVAACASSHISREDTPIQTPRESKDITPRAHHDKTKPASSRKHTTPRKKSSKTPKSAKKCSSPRKNSATVKNKEETPKIDKEEVKPVEDAPRETNDDDHKTTHEIKVELTPKSPESIIEQIPGIVQYDANMESRRTLESPKKYANKGAQKEYQENVTRMDRELVSPRRRQDGHTDGRKSERNRNKVTETGPGSCEVSRLLRQLCGGDASGNRNERVSGAKNAQLLCISGGSPRQPSTPQLLRILEETIQKKLPKPVCQKPRSAQDTEKLRLALSVPPQSAERQLQYRGKFVQHMLTSAMYANCAVGKPWEVIGSVSDQIIDELLLRCAREMELSDVVHELYHYETR